MPDPVPFAEIQRRRLEAFGNSPPPEEEVTPPALPLPGTTARLELMKARARSGEPCHQAGDVLHHPEVLADPRRARNGHAKSCADRQQEKVPPAQKGQRPECIPERNTKQPTLGICLLPIVDRVRLGERLRLLRLGRKLSLGAVALEVGLSRSQVFKLEAGRYTRQPRLSTVWRLADLFGVTLDWLVGRDG